MISGTKLLAKRKFKINVRQNISFMGCKKQMKTVGKIPINFKVHDKKVSGCQKDNLNLPETHFIFRYTQKKFKKKLNLLLQKKKKKSSSN